ncbi:hypothetical protein M3Y94_00734700 [Aphelenchoides besseyi]|nr:hypothetical protein M3Y94_00734700 [Aphelenchoides besseyi]KAI6231924.1 Histone-lysine N-methyltransferase EHMT2-like [Aphelenchoides besseyi]
MSGDDPMTSNSIEVDYWRLLQDKKKKKDAVVLVDDISFKQEKWPIPVINEVNQDTVNARFQYGVRSIRVGKHAKSEKCCDCKDGKCKTSSCYCYANSNIRVKNGKITNLRAVIDEPMDRVLLECRKECKCKRKCSNKFTSQRIKSRVDVNYFAGKDFGVRIRDYRQRGTFFCEYVGEILNRNGRDNTHFQFGIHKAEKTKNRECYIDAKAYSNIGRFLNHSCDPSLVPFLFVATSNSSLSYPQLGFVFCRDVIVGQELTIDYGPDYWNDRDIDCCCYSTKCIKPPKETREKSKIKRKNDEILEAAEEKRCSRLVDEFERCRQRLELIRKGESIENALKLIPQPHQIVSARRTSKRSSSKTRDSSPLVWPDKSNLMPITLD